MDIMRVRIVFERLGSIWTSLRCSTRYSFTPGNVA